MLRWCKVCLIVCVGWVSLGWADLVRADPLKAADVFGRWSDGADLFSVYEPRLEVTFLVNGRFHEVRHEAFVCHTEGALNPKETHVYAVAGRWRVDGTQVITEATHQLVFRKGECVCEEMSRIPCHFQISEFVVKPVQGTRTWHWKGAKPHTSMDNGPMQAVEMVLSKRVKLYREMEPEVLDYPNTSDYFPESYLALFEAPSSVPGLPREVALAHALKPQTKSHTHDDMPVFLHSLPGAKVALQVRQGTAKCDVVGTVTASYPLANGLYQTFKELLPVCVIKRGGMQVQVKGTVMLPDGASVTIDDYDDESARYQSYIIEVEHGGKGVVLEPVEPQSTEEASSP